MGMHGDIHGSGYRERDHCWRHLSASCTPSPFCQPYPLARNEPVAIMKTNTLPKSIRAAINAQAFRIAQTQAYEALRVALEQRAQALMQKPDASVQDAILVLESSQVLEDLMISVSSDRVHTPAPGAGWPFPMAPQS